MQKNVLCVEVRSWMKASLQWSQGHTSVWSYCMSTGKKTAHETWKAIWSGNPWSHPIFECWVEKILHIYLPILLESISTWLLVGNQLTQLVLDLIIKVFRLSLFTSKFIWIDMFNLVEKTRVNSNWAQWDMTIVALDWFDWDTLCPKLYPQRDLSITLFFRD